MSPSKEACYRIIYDSGMLENIVQHSFKVSHVAEVITFHMVQNGCELDPALIATAALLHDITKTRSLSTKEIHAETGGDFLREMGYFKEAEIVRQHVILDSYSYDDCIKPEEIVNYSDKRVLHDKIVGLDERMEYILERYGTDINKENKIRLVWENTKKLEEKLFRRIPFEPDDLIGNTGEDGLSEYFDFVAFLSR